MSIFERFVKKNAEAGFIKKREQRLGEMTKTLLENIEQDKESCLNDAEGIDACVPDLKLALQRHLESQKAPESAEETAATAVDAAPYFCLSEDRMRAYACLMPPLNGGRDMTMETFLEDLHYEGICQGILEEQASRQVAAKHYLHVFPVASGKEPEHGKDGEIMDLFERKGALQLEVPGETVVDFNAGTLVQAVRKGDIICRITLPVPGKDGQDVTGSVLPCQDGAKAEVPAGENTHISDGGLLLLAAIDGAVVMENGKFCVKRQQIIMDDVDETSKAISCPGDLYIGGNVSGGAKVEAGGNIIINGALIDGHVTSTKGSIRVQKGVQGSVGKAVTLKAARQIQALSIESARAEAGGDIFAEVVTESDVTSGSGVYVLGGRGLILGGHIKAKNRVAAKKIGNLSQQRNQITVGYSPKLSSDIAQTEKELLDIKATLEKLRKSVSGMRAAGELLSLEKRAVLAQLMEQKNLYENKEESLNKKLKELKQALHAATSGRITCQELYPVTAVQIGDRMAEFQSAETACSIHVYAGKVMVK